MKKIILVSFLFLTLIGCNSKKVFRLLQSGTVVQTEFKTEIPFEMRMGLIILKVDIQGKQYDFLLDTGAPNVVSYELAHELGLSPEGHNTIRDSQGKRQSSDFTYIDTISINGIQFINTGTAIMDLKQSSTLSCMQIDGIIGANLMKYAIWQFNYQKQVLTLTSNIDSLTFSDSTITVPFKTKRTGTPVVGLIMDSNIIQQNITLDMGSNGDIRLRNSTYQKLKEKNLIISHNRGYGQLSSGIFGRGDVDTTNFFKIQNLRFGDVHLHTQIYSASETRSSTTIGTSFFKNYILTFNWNTNEAILDPVSTYRRNTMTNYGFRRSYKNGKLVVGYIYENSSALQKGLKLGDRILKIDDLDYTNLSDTEWCEMLLDDSNKENTNPIKITILRDGETQELTIEKSVVLE